MNDMTPDMRALLDALPLAVCFVDCDRVIRACNADFAKEAGAAHPGDLADRDFDEVSPFGMSDRHEDENLLAAGGGTEEKPLEIRIGSGGSGEGGAAGTRHFTLRRTVLRSPDGRILGLLKAYRDATPLAAATRAAQQAERAKMTFLANMSHELRTPMNGIVGMADLILDHPATEPMQRLHAETIIRSAKTLQMVIDEVLDVATLQDASRRFAAHAAPFPLLYLAEEAAQIVSCIIESQGMELSLGYDFALRALYTGDARHIRQILVQILTHASRLTRDRRIRLEVAGTGSIEEEGIAFRVIFQPREDVDVHAVNAMFRHSGQAGEDTRSAIHLGLFNDRIGLPLTWELVKGMGGSLTVTRQFRDIRCEVILPLRGGGDPQPVAAPDLKGFRALVAAAVPERGWTAKNCFEYAAATVARAETADAALTALRRAKDADKLFDFLFLDAEIAPGDGLPAFVEAIREIYAAAGAEPNIMLAAAPEQVQELRLPPSAVKCLLLPPVCPSDLWYKADSIVAAALEAQENAASPSAAEAQKPRRRRSTRIQRIVHIGADVLLAEDNPVNQMVATGLLKRIGCRATLVKNGAEAVEAVVNSAARGERYDIILMDCLMPVMDGYKATEKIRQYEKQNPDAERNVIVALTANSLAGDRELCLAAGMDDYVTKPVTLERLRDCLTKHCAAKVTMLDIAKEQ